MSHAATSTRRRVFTDTSAYFALTDRDDHNHTAARRIAHELQRHQWVVYTSICIVAEQHALHLARLGPDIARQALALIDQSAVRIVRPIAADEARTREILNRFTDKHWSRATRRTSRTYAVSPLSSLERVSSLPTDLFLHGSGASSQRHRAVHEVNCALQSSSAVAREGTADEGVTSDQLV